MLAYSPRAAPACAARLDGRTRRGQQPRQHALSAYVQCGRRLTVAMIEPSYCPFLVPRTQGTARAICATYRLFRRPGQADNNSDEGNRQLTGETHERYHGQQRAAFHVD